VHPYQHSFILPQNKKTNCLTNDYKLVSEISRIHLSSRLRIVPPLFAAEDVETSTEVKLKKDGNAEESFPADKDAILEPIVIQKEEIEESFWKKQLGVELDGEIVAILLIYFVQGALGLARLATSFFLKDELHLQPADLAAITGILSLPWVLKPLYGFISDGLPLFGSRRRSYIFLSGLLGASAWTALSQASIVTDAKSAVAMSVVTSLSVAISDVVADSIVVEKARKAGSQAVSGSLQSLCWGSSSVGGIISAYFSGQLLEIITARQIFGITAVLPAIVSLSSFLIQEEEYIAESVKSQIQTLWDAIKQKSVWLPALFVFLWQATPTSDSAFFYYLTNEIHITPEFFGRLRLASSIASLAGVWIFQSYLKEVPISKMLLYTTLIGVPLGFLPLALFYHINAEFGIPDTWFMFGDDVVLAVLGQIAFMPTLVLAARICPPGVEGTLFATLMSIFNGGSVVGSEIGAVLTKNLDVTETNFTNLPILLIICNLSSLLPLPLLGWIKEQDVEKLSSETNDAIITTDDKAM